MRFRRADLFWVPALAVSAGMSLFSVLTGGGGGWAMVPMALLAYPAGRRMTSLRAALGVFVAVTVAGALLAALTPEDPRSGWISMVFLEFTASVLPWWVGRYRHLRAEQAEREHGIVAEQARLRERARIARDMHDSLGHELALIALHGGVLELAADLTEERRRSAAELRECAVRATHRLHEIVEVLGDNQAAAELRPVNEGIEALVQRAASAGLPVRLCQDGPAPAWSPTVGQAAHRVVQEALTNAARHAPGARVTVTLARQDAATRVEVANGVATRPAGAEGTGQGLIGLDERVRLAGGRLTAGPRRDGGWTVTALLPDDRAEGVPDPATPAVDLGVSRRQTRRRMLQTAALPVGGGLALIAAIVLTQVLTVDRSGLAADRYGQLRVGQPRAAVERLLPPDDLGEKPRVSVTPSEPPGATCVYYQAGNGIVPSRPGVYQLCFADGVLVAKRRWELA